MMCVLPWNVSYFVEYCQSGLEYFALYVGSHVYICWGDRHFLVPYIVYNNPGRTESHL